MGSFHAYLAAKDGILVYSGSFIFLGIGAKIKPYSSILITTSDRALCLK